MILSLHRFNVLKCPIFYFVNDFGWASLRSTISRARYEPFLWQFDLRRIEKFRVLLVGRKTGKQNLCGPGPIDSRRLGKKKKKKKREINCRKNTRSPPVPSSAKWIASITDSPYNKTIFLSGRYITTRTPRKGDRLCAAASSLFGRRFLSSETDPQERLPPPSWWWSEHSSTVISIAA